MTADERDRIAEAFASARRDGTALPRYPGSAPETLDEAYAIQRRVVERLGLPVLGWKIARLSDAESKRWGVERIFGPVCRIWECSDGEPQVPLISGGFSAAETEIQLLLGDGVGKAGAASGNQEELVDSVRIGIEVAGSPLGGINDHGAAVTVSDLCNNIGVVLGPPCGPLSAVTRLAVHSILDGETVARGIAGDTPREALRFLLGEAPRRGWSLQPGQWISSGAITGGHPIVAGQHFAASADRDGEQRRVSASFTQY